jgi:uncharacterized surface protein with fasciclin (FAS1) repeats
MTDKNIKQIISEEGNFETLNRAVEKSGLSDLLSDAGPYTLFAPTDDAFGNISEEALSELFNDNEKLAETINHHLVGAEYSASELEEIDVVDTLDGMSLDVSKGDGTIMIEQSEVIKPDLEATNGVIHVIDRVLLP